MGTIHYAAVEIWFSKYALLKRVQFRVDSADTPIPEVFPLPHP